MAALRCDRCLGHGYLEMRWSNEHPPYNHKQWFTCSNCYGTGEPKGVGKLDMKCKQCKGRGRRQPDDLNGDSIDCHYCEGTGRVKITIIDNKTMMAPLTQFLDTEPSVRDMTKDDVPPKSGEILTEIMDGLIRASTDATWLAFESNADREKIKGIELQLWNLRGMLGNYLHAMREESNGH